MTASHDLGPLGKLCSPYFPVHRKRKRIREKIKTIFKHAIKKSIKMMKPKINPTPMSVTHTQNDKWLLYTLHFNQQKKEKYHYYINA